jgi:hypothetical protein
MFDGFTDPTRDTQFVIHLELFSFKNIDLQSFTL